MGQNSLMEIKENISRARKEAGIKQGEMAKLLNISQPAYSYYETGDKPIPLDKIKKIAELLSLPLSAVLGDSINDPKNEGVLHSINENLTRIADALEKLVKKQ